MMLRVWGVGVSAVGCSFVGVDVEDARSCSIS